MVIHGYIWLYMVIHGYIWLYMVIYGYTWLYMGIRGLNHCLKFHCNYSETLNNEYIGRIHQMSS